ncbi:MAG: hypothetical protein AAFR99_20330, partial [Cyanobacteria bacterium J06629_9]
TRCPQQSGRGYNFHSPTVLPLSVAMVTIQEKGNISIHTENIFPIIKKWVNGNYSLGHFAEGTE